MKTLLEALKILMNGLAMVSSSSGYASSANGGYVYNVTINDGGYAWFAYTGTLVGSLPACADPMACGL